VFPKASKSARPSIDIHKREREQLCSWPLAKQPPACLYAAKISIGQFRQLFEVNNPYNFILLASPSMVTRLDKTLAWFKTRIMFFFKMNQIKFKFLKESLLNNIVLIKIK
jgi:hypothetical protein